MLHICICTYVCVCINEKKKNTVINHQINMGCNQIRGGSKGSLKHNKRIVLYVLSDQIFRD